MKTIRQRLTWKLLLGFTALLAMGGLGVWLSTRAALLKEFDATLRAKALAITTATEQENDHIDVDFSDRFMRGFGERVATDFFEMWDRRGAVLERSESLGDSTLPRRFGTLAEPVFWDLPSPSGFACRAVGFQFTPQVSREKEINAASSIGDVVLVVASDRRELDRTLSILALVLLACGVTLLIAMGLVVPRVLRQELAPLNQLADQTACINAESLATRFPSDGLPGELAPITGRLNDLLARLEQAFERERQFSADLAHELRTPIAELRNLAEVALKWPDVRETSTDRETLAIALQMEGIVTRLLALLRCEREQLPIATQRVALAPLLQSAWQPFAERAAAKELIVAANATEDIEVQTDPVLLRSILTNLMDNAVEYTPRGGTIRAEGTMNDGRFRLSVTNTTDSLTEEDVAHFFERFWRKETARSDSKHAGLGLSLAKAFCECLGLQLGAQFVDHGTLSITVTGPTASREKPPN